MKRLFRRFRPEKHLWFAGFLLSIVTLTCPVSTTAATENQSAANDSQIATNGIAVLNEVKWQQRPEMVRGVNILSIPVRPTSPTVADDWLCLAGSPLDDLHFWGSYIGWQENLPRPTASPPGVLEFRIQIYSDAPATSPDSFSRPDKLLYEEIVTEFDETFVASNLLTPGEEPTYEHKFRYDLELPRVFWQKRDRIYWLNIAAVPRNPEFSWGWENSKDRWNDAAVTGFYINQNNWNWQPVPHPMTQLPINMAFELTACEGPSKWLQFPDMADGRNLVALPERRLADDWLCTDGKPITEVHFWGSYLSLEGQMHWEENNAGPPSNPLPPTPGMDSFILSFHEDVPAGVDQKYSHPGELIREVPLGFNEVVERYWGSIPHTDPTGRVWWEHKFYYIARLAEPFEQERGKIYWLDIGAKPRPDSRWFWGWETSKDHWNDNAVRWGVGQWDELGGSVNIGFEDLVVSTVYNVGDTFVSSGIPIDVASFQSVMGTARVGNGGLAGGSGNEINLNNVTLIFNYDIPLIHLNLAFGEYGGDVSVMINGVTHVVANLSELDGQVIGGVEVSVVGGGGNDQGTLSLNGVINQFATGGQEYYIDNVRSEAQVDMAFQLITPDDTDYCEADFDRDGDVDGSDLAVFSADFGRTDCFDTGTCEADFDYDGDVDGSDLAIFSADFGRTDCPCNLPPMPAAVPK